MRQKFNQNQQRSFSEGAFLGKGDLKICSTLIGEYPCRSVISINFLCRKQDDVKSHKKLR